MTNADWLISPPAAQILPGLSRERVRMAKIKETERGKDGEDQRDRAGKDSIRTRFFFCKSRDS